jgi:tocopherol cyclase
VFDGIKALWKPEVYHGSGKRRSFFEGWYYKLVDRQGRYPIAVIPGVSMERDGQCHSFIQILLGEEKKSCYCRYEIDDFQGSARKLDITLAENRFTDKGLSLNVTGPDISARGEIEFGPLAPWPATLGSPGAMGWYAFVPFMECYHGIISMDHALWGSLLVNGREMDFSGDRGYMEKDWGRSFPSAWIWMQSNHFEEEGTSFTLSIARIPWLGYSFTGFIGGLWHKNRLHRFATYTGAKIVRLEYRENVTVIYIKDRNFHLEVEAEQVIGGELFSPTMGRMEGRVNESLASRLNITLRDRNGVIFSGTGLHAGFERTGFKPMNQKIQDKIEAQECQGECKGIYRV